MKSMLYACNKLANIKKRKGVEYHNVKNQTIYDIENKNLKTKSYKCCLELVHHNLDNVMYILLYRINSNNSINKLYCNKI